MQPRGGMSTSAAKARPRSPISTISWRLPRLWRKRRKAKTPISSLPRCFMMPSRIVRFRRSSSRRRSGADVADLVVEVTDDKTLEKGERKKRQVESAHKKTDRAKVLKLADKTSNLRALVSSPAPDWSVRRKIEYIEWARKVVEGLRGASPSLETQFDEAALAAEQSLVPTW
jgi:hypothetical protein